MERPPVVKPVAVGLAAIGTLNLVGGVIWGESAGVKLYVAAICLIAYAVIWFFGQGRNWARLTILAYSVIVLMNALMAPSTDPTYLLKMASAALGVLLLFVLNRPDVRAWFNKSREPRTIDP